MKPFVLQKDMIKKCTSGFDTCKIKHTHFRQSFTSTYSHSKDIISLSRPMYTCKKIKLATLPNLSLLTDKYIKNLCIFVHNNL